MSDTTSTIPATIDDLLVRARSGLRRLDPAQAFRAVRHGAVLVDTRPEWQRRADGEIPCAVIIERNHLEWRCDPSSPGRAREAVSHEVTWIICCDEGYSSSLAAATLQVLGLRNATDLIGGFRAWRAAGLPVATPDNQAGRDCRDRAISAPAGLADESRPLAGKSAYGGVIADRSYSTVTGSEDEIRAHLKQMTGRLTRPERAIFNIHVPPYNSRLDTAPLLGQDLKVKTSAGAQVTAPVGSVAVREAIEEIQPLPSSVAARWW